MKTTLGKVLGSASLLSVLGFILVNGSTAKDDSLQRISKYKEWTRVISQLPPTNTLTSLGG
jgi:hypothetical protein